MLKKDVEKKLVVAERKVLALIEEQDFAIRKAGFKNLDALIKKIKIVDASYLTIKELNNEQESKIEKLEARLKSKGTLMNDMVARHKKKVEQLECLNDNKGDRLHDLSERLNKSENTNCDLRAEVHGCLTVIKIYNDRGML